MLHAIKCSQCGKEIAFTIKEKKAKQGWISVKDRLPKRGERVLITEGTAVFEAYRSISGNWVRMGIGWAEGVTHWMPLPEPPEGK